MTWTLGEMASAVGGTLHGPVDAPVEGASIDTRSLAPGQAFYAMAGERADGHDFLGIAAGAGAAVAIVSRKPARPPGLPWIEVSDTTLALQAAGRALRRRLSARVIGLTGSCGKTTTKELIAAALSAFGPVSATRGNLNNHLGVPLTISNVGSGDAYAVVEMGANHPGEIGLLASLADPDVGIVTCVAEAHTEFFGDLAGVARAKGELFLAMRGDSVAVVNIDDRMIGAMPLNPERSLTYGRAGARPRARTHVRLVGASAHGGGGQEIDLDVAGSPIRTRIMLDGDHMALNATAAVAVAVAVGADPAVAAAALASVRPVNGRGAVARGRRLDVIDDTYNANPASMEAGLQALVSVAGPRRKVAVLGDMRELGKNEAAMHSRVGRSAAAHGVDLLVAVGGCAGDTARGAKEAGMGRVEIFGTVDDALAPGAIQGLVREGDIVLVKGSRAMKMERIVEALLYW